MNRLSQLKIRRALLSVSDKTKIAELARALEKSGAEIVATGRTARVLDEAGIRSVPIEAISGSPESFQGRMKTLSFPVLSGVLYRRGDAKDEEDVRHFRIKEIDCVVVNFYPLKDEKGEGEIDIGGPTLVRAAAKNAPDVLVLTSPEQYDDVIRSLSDSGGVRSEIVQRCAEAAWDVVLRYDQAIAQTFGSQKRRALRYGENPHQKGFLEEEKNSPIAWSLGSGELSYNNILDVTAAYGLASELTQLFPHSTAVVVVKHGNPCGVTLVPKKTVHAQKIALIRAWEGDPVSAFGGTLIFTDPLEEESATWLSQHFIEVLAGPQLNETQRALEIVSAKRKKLKSVLIRRFGEGPQEIAVNIPGGRLVQTSDIGPRENLNCVTRTPWPKDKEDLAHFGISVCRALKSNAIAVVRELHSGSGIFQLVGAGQGQPNRIDALKSLAIPRAQSVLSTSEGRIEDCILISDAFFPFRDAVDCAHGSGIRAIVQPGGSIRDEEIIAACNEYGISMAVTGVRHFRH